MATTAMRSSPLPASNKRKRGPGDQDVGRISKSQNTNGDGSVDASFAAVHQALQGMDQNLNGLLGGDESSRTAQAALATPLQSSSYPEPGSFNGAQGMGGGFDDGSPTGQGMGSGAQQLYDARQSSNKPAVGTEQWHQQRKDNHKEVERRRREVINEGIENISKIVPGCERNKGAILQRTHQYIGELQGKERSFQTERDTCEIALKELTNRVDRMKQTAEAAWAESNKWQQRCRDAGLQFDDYDDGALPGIGEDDGIDGP